MVTHQPDTSWSDGFSAQLHGSRGIRTDLSFNQAFRLKLQTSLYLFTVQLPVPDASLRRCKCTKMQLLMKYEMAFEPSFFFPLAKEIIKLTHNGTS